MASKGISVLFYFMVVISVASAWDFFSKNCCEPHDDERLGRICDDGSRAPFIGCCGRGPCNIACCNCDNGCLSGRHTPQKFLGVWGADISPNFGLTGNSPPVAAGEFLGELAKNAASGTGRGVLGIGTGAAKKDPPSEIEYHKG